MRAKTLSIVAIISALLISCASQKALFDKASNIDTIEGYKEFLQKYPNSQYSLSAWKKLANLSFTKTKKENTILAYENYISEFPNSDSINAAKHNLSYLNSKKDNTISAYEGFLKAFPSSIYKDEINNELENIYFHKVKEDHTISTYENFLRDFPKSIHKKEIDDKLEDLYFQNAKEDSSVESSEKYLVLYPNGNYEKEAENLLEHAYYSKAIKTNTIESYAYFLNKYPASSFTNVILRNYENLLYELIQTRKDESLVSEYLQRFPNSKNSSKLRLEFDDMNFENAKKDYHENLKMQKLEEYLTEYPNGKNVKKAQELIREFRQLVTTIIAIEDIAMLEKCLDGVPDSNLSKQGSVILNGQKALLSGNLEGIDIERINKLDSSYGKDFVEIVVAIRSSSTPNILMSAKALADQGNFGELFSLLLKIQPIVDNRLLRHTMARLLYIASQNFKMPLSLSEVNSFQENMSKYNKQLDSKNLKLGAISGNPDFGNVLMIASTLTMVARARSIITNIPMNEFKSGRIGFNGVIELMQQVGPLAGAINSQVIAGVKMLLREQYRKLDIKGRHAVLQWLEYLIENAQFGVTLRVGEVNVDLKKAIDGEHNSLLKDKGERILNAIKSTN